MDMARRQEQSGLISFRAFVDWLDDQAENGIHYYLAEADLLEGGYEPPFLHFDEDEAPAFLLPAVQEYLKPAARPDALHSPP